MTKIAFVAEGYDYFQELFRSDEVRVVEIYREFTETPSISADDLRARDGVYRRYTGNQFAPWSPAASGETETVAEPGGLNPRNRFNINPGIVHLSHRANSLGAEVNLAGVSGIARKKVDGTTLDGADPEKLLCCNAGGNPNRNSDPLISAQAYAQVLAGYRYTLANPVGLYIAGVADGLLLPDNKTPVPKEWWREVRGEGFGTTAPRTLRLELEIPSTEKLTISDLLIGGDPVKYPGQIAELLSVHLFVTRWKRADASIGPVVGCEKTCCQKHGTEQKALTNGECPEGYDSLYTDLLPDPAEPAPVAAPVPKAALLSLAMSAPFRVRVHKR
ncbi:hypothetical protein ACFOWB_25420 [Chenggangzhangella methanolivorans]|uniref:hypothetical protein n=1 Tax=Chenggangzhangella methanolivorans TaxID=1437009 RepID=UPI00360D6250